jgi:uncharacterized membrane protein YgcG
MHRNRSVASAVIAALALLLAGMLSGCGASTNNSGTGAFDDIASHQEVQGSKCYKQMDADQVAQMQQVAASENRDLTITDDSNDTQKVCVLEPTANGGYEEHYYNQNDGLQNYLLYSMLVGRSNSLATYGLLSGDLSVGDAMALSLLMNVGNDGRVYSEYSNTGGRWHRDQQVNTHYRVTNIQYGHARPVSYAKARTAPAPRGYARPTTPPVTKTEGTVAKSGIIKPVKKVASSNTYKNPSSSSGSSSSSSSSSGSSTTKKKSGGFSFGGSRKSTSRKH